MRLCLALLAVVLATVVLAASTVRGQTANGEWRAYAADGASSRYAPLNQIHAGNIAALETAWRWTTIDQPILDADPSLWTWKNESTPIMVAGVLYTSTSLSQVAALDAATGATLWTFDPGSYHVGSPPNNGFLHRGVSYWEDGADRRIFIGTGDGFLWALDAATGAPIPSFGEDGRIDLTLGLRRPMSRIQYGVSSPPVVCRDVVVVGSSIWDYPFSSTMAPGDVRGFDPVTGAVRWIFASVPQGSDFGADTWGAAARTRFGNTNVWTTMSCDEASGLVYLPFGTPSNDYYGGERPGDNLFAESLVALHAETGVRAWHYQIVRHGIWDYDLPAAPNLLDVTVDGRPVEAVAQVTKHGALFVFDRVTGAPVWPIEDRPVPRSFVPGEQAAPTQPFPTRPAPFEQQGATEDDLIDFTDALRAEAVSALSFFDHGPLFTPPSLRGTVTVPGVSGGGSWAGAAVHPPTGRLFVPSIKGTWLLKVWQNPHRTDYAYKGAPTYGPMGPRGLPLMKPPYGRITAIDLNTGDHLWHTPVGEGPRDHVSLRHLNLPRLGWARRIFVLVTDSLLFAAQEGINVGRGSTPRGNASEIATINADPALLAFDLNDGTLLATIPLPSNAAGSPITYMAGGRQYVAVPVGGASQTAELVALALDPALVKREAPPVPLPADVLGQSYPNPLRHEAVITYALARQTEVELAVFNGIGQRVRTLIAGQQAAGMHRVRFGRENLPAGVYYYRLTTATRTQTRKLVVLR